MREEEFRAAGYDVYVVEGSLLCFKGPHAHAVLTTGVHYCGAGGTVLVNLKTLGMAPPDPEAKVKFLKFARAIGDVFKDLHPQWQVNKVTGVVVQKGDKQ